MTEPYQSAAAVEAAIREVTVTPPANRLDLPRLPSNDYRLDLGASVREGSEGRALLL